MLIFCIGIILGIIIGCILMATIAASGNNSRIEEAYHIGFKDGSAMNLKEHNGY